MTQLILVAALLLCSINSFHIYDAVMAIQQNNLKDIDWPFTPCGDGDWKIEKLTLGGQPTRNTNDDITVVTYLLFRLELLLTVLILLQLILRSNSTVCSFTMRALPSNKAMMREIQSNSNTPTLSLVLLLLEPMVLPSCSRTKLEKIMDVLVSALNCDRFKLSCHLYINYYILS